MFIYYNFQNKNLINNLKLKKMSNVKNANAKKTTTKNQVAKKDEIVKINLSKFSKALESKIIERKSTERITLYKYPNTFTKEQINAKQGKQFRSKLRTKLNNFTNNIFLFAKQNRVSELKTEIKNFDSFYKENYLLNDYSLNSLTNINEDKEKFTNIKLMLEIINEVKSAK